MTVYVDDLVNNLWKLRGKYVKNCHMWSDENKEELLDFAKKIGLKKEWIQISRSGLIHFDLVTKKRERAIERGAIPLNRLEAKNMKREKKC